MVEVRLRHRHFVKALTVDLIGHAHRDFVQIIEHVEFGQHVVGEAVDAACIAGDDRVKPAAATRPAGVHAEFPTLLLQVFAHVVKQLRRERTCTHAGGVGLHNSDHAVDAGGPDAGSNTGTAGCGVRGRDERVGSVVNIEHGRLAALHDDDLAVIESLVQQQFGFGDHGRNAVAVLREVLHDFLNRDIAAVVHLDQKFVLLAQRAFDLLPENRFVEQVLHADAQACRLIHVGGADAATGGADRALAQEPFGDLVQRLVERGDKVGVGRDLKLRRVSTAGFQTVDFGEERFEVHNDAVADHGHNIRRQNASRQQLEFVLFTADNHRVPGVVAAVGLDDIVDLGSQDVCCLALAFVAPLGTDDHDCRHSSPHVDFFTR